MRRGFCIAGVLLVLSALATGGRAHSQALGSATLDWIPPTTYVDNSVMQLGTQYAFQSMVQGGCLPDPLVAAECVDAGNVGPQFQTLFISGLWNGTYYFVVVASDQNGIRSLPSNEASKTIDIPGNLLRPNPPTNLTAT